MQNDNETWFTQREQAHAAVLFVVLFAAVALVRLILPMPTWLLLSLGVLPLGVPLAVATWERHRRRGKGR